MNDNKAMLTARKIKEYGVSNEPNIFLNNSLQLFLNIEKFDHGVLSVMTDTAPFPNGTEITLG